MGSAQFTIVKAIDTDIGDVVVREHLAADVDDRALPDEVARDGRDQVAVVVTGGVGEVGAPAGAHLRQGPSSC